MRRLLLVMAGVLLPVLAAAAPAPTSAPQKIVVYGGSGNIGSRIVAEAAARGHRVTVVDRNPRTDRAPAGVTLVQGDALDAADIARRIAGVDAVVSAVVVRPMPTAEFGVDVVKAMVEAQRRQPAAARPRLLVVGGASSLYNDKGQRLVDTLPPQFAQSHEVRSMVAALDWLRTVKDTRWTFVSPSMSINPGRRTGKFRLGTEQVLVDAAGNSAISMEDFAVAMIDEIEKPQYVNQRFTVGY